MDYYHLKDESAILTSSVHDDDPLRDTHSSNPNDESEFNIQEGDDRPTHCQSVSKFRSRTKFINAER